MPHSSVISRAPQGRLSSSAGVSTSPAVSRYPLTYSSYRPMSKCTLSSSGSSSAAVLAPKRMESPKSLAARPGMMVSRSMMHSPSPVAASKRMLLSLVSLWVTRRGSSPCSCWRTSRPQSSRRACAKAASGRHRRARSITSRRSAFSKASYRRTVS